MNWTIYARDLIGYQLLERIEAGDDIALLPVGSTELHGPQLPLGTDSFIAQAVCELAARELRATVFDPVNYSWPGMTKYSRPTISLTMQLEYDFIRAIVEQLQRTGFRRIGIVQFHGPGIAMTRLAREYFEETGFPIAFYGLMRMTGCGKDLCRERNVAWEASMCAAAVKLLNIKAQIDTAPIPASAQPPLTGSAAMKKITGTGAMVGCLGSHDLHHGVFNEKICAETGLEILRQLAGQIIETMPALGEYEKLWRDVNLGNSWKHQ